MNGCRIWWFHDGANLGSEQVYTRATHSCSRATHWWSRATHWPFHHVRLPLTGHDSQGAHVPLTGLAVGNGLTAPEIQYKYYSEMAYKNSARPLVSKTVYEAMKLSSAACLAQIRICQDKDAACNAAFTFCALTQVSPPPPM